LNEQPLGLGSGSGVRPSGCRTEPVLFGMTANGLKWVFERGRNIMSSYMILVLLLLDIYSNCVIGKMGNSVSVTLLVRCCSEEPCVWDSTLVMSCGPCKY